MNRRLRALVEKLLPWFDRAEASAHDARTQAIIARNIAARIRAEKERDRLALVVKNAIKALQS